MLSIFIKELKSFFSSLTGYIAAIVFLTTTGLVLWIIPGNLNILDGGVASLDSLFAIAPWVFLFLVPAITMRSFADEKKSGTIELILTRPVSDTAIVTGKFLAAFVLVIVLLLPTLIYYYSVYKLGNPVGNIDVGGTWGSFIGLLLLAAIYAAIGIFASTITDNSIVAFLLAVVFSLFVYTGISSLASFNSFSGIKQVLLNLSIVEHYSSLSRGVIDSRDVIYFVSVTLLFLIFARTIIESRKW